VCGAFVKGIGIINEGVSFGDGYNAHLESNVSTASYGQSGGNLNAPAAMQGNGAYSVVDVLRLDANSYDGYYWMTGSGAQSVGLANIGASTHYFRLNIGGGSYSTAWAPAIGNWYFTVTTVSAGTTHPNASIWIGGATTPGVLGDILSGVTPPTVTPAISATPFVLESTALGGHLPNASHAALMIYSKALTYNDVSSLYQAMKAKLLERGVTLQ
jgi:hypothetical protein